jgi:SAM-dependent methyltransferase
VSEIQAYYNRIGSEYDNDRFGSSSYGQYIHHQECAFFAKWLPEQPKGRVLDMGCGTGRFMDRATDGVDFSEGMMAEARKRHPEKRFHFGTITETGLEAASFDKAFSMHVLMHLDEATTNGFFEEAHRLLKHDGLLIVDFPSATRRSFGQRKVENWHGSNAFTVAGLQKMTSEKFDLIAKRGILFFPIHRFPKGVRKALLAFDTLLCRTFLRSYASYLIIVLRKK